MRHPANRQLHAYWDALRGGRVAPRRDEVDPTAIRGILASVFVLDVAAPGRPGDAVFRVSGTRLDALFGRPLRSSGFDRIWAPRSLPLAANALDAVLDGARPTTAAARGSPRGYDAVDIDVLMLPLAAGGAHGAQVLGCLAALSAPGWMGLAAAIPLDILALDAGARGPGRSGFGRRVWPPGLHFRRHGP